MISLEPEQRNSTGCESAGAFIDSRRAHDRRPKCASLFATICALLALRLKKQNVLLSFSVAFMIFSCSACSMFVQIIHVRYRLTVDVWDGKETKSASGVVDVRYDIYPDSFVSLGAPDTSPRVTGSAITVDLGAKGLLFLTFRNARRTPEERRLHAKLIRCGLDDIACLPFAAYQIQEGGEGGFYSHEKYRLNHLLQQSGQRDVPPLALPELARFTDINDPDTLDAVAPSDFAKIFGPSFELKRVTLELTREPVTPPPDFWPQWLKTMRDNYVFKGMPNG